MEQYLKGLLKELKLLLEKINWEVYFPGGVCGSGGFHEHQIIPHAKRIAPCAERVCFDECALKEIRHGIFILCPNRTVSVFSQIDHLLGFGKEKEAREIIEIFIGIIEKAMQGGKVV